MVPVARRSSRLASTALAGAAIAATFVSVGRSFVPPARGLPQQGLQVATAGAVLASAAPAHAEEGLLNFGKVEIGGGFAINLDIPETGIVNIAVLIAGLFYLLAPILSESMSTREKEIQQDIDDAIAKYNEATTRLAEAEKAQAQAAEVVAEIEASISKDQAEFKEMCERNAEIALKKQEAATEKVMKDLAANADQRVESYVERQSVVRGMQELKKLTDAQKAKFMEEAIASL